MAVNGVEIEVGQVWRTRGGRAVAIVEKKENIRPFIWVGRPFGFAGSREDLTFNCYGDEWSEGEASPNDLMSAIFDREGMVYDHAESAVETATTAVASLTLPCTGLYGTLGIALHAAFEQASAGKGLERHANGKPFEEQPMSVINRQLGSVDGFIYQAQKKSLEAKRLPPERARAEILGAINYLAGAYIALGTWANGEQP